MGANPPGSHPILKCFTKRGISVFKKIFEAAEEAFQKDEGLHPLEVGKTYTKDELNSLGWYFGWDHPTGNRYLEPERTHYPYYEWERVGSDKFEITKLITTEDPGWLVNPYDWPEMSVSQLRKIDRSTTHIQDPDEVAHDEFVDYMLKKLGRSEDITTFYELKGDEVEDNYIKWCLLVSSAS